MAVTKASPQPTQVYSNDGGELFFDASQSSFSKNLENNQVVGTRGQVQSLGQRVNVYADLQAGSYIGELAYVNNSSGTQWLPSTLGGTYRPRGWYLWNGTEWVSDRNNIANAIETNTTTLDSKANVVHTHVKADITDFSDSHYATAAQGLLAGTAVQPNDNISTLTNDSNFITVDSLKENGLSQFYQEFTYTSGDLTKIEYWDSSSKNTKYFTKDFTYTSGSLTQLVLTNNSNNATETKTFSYNGNGDLTNITKS